jgi:hypothetical protein
MECSEVSLYRVDEYPRRLLSDLVLLRIMAKKGVPSFWFNGSNISFRGF